MPLRSPSFSRVSTQILLAGVVALSAEPSLAQGGALAESLFQEGKELIEAGKIAEACAKFDASYKVDPSTGTLINLGTCREREGKLASAWAAYNKALPQARSEGRSDRAGYCEQRIKALTPLLSTVTVNVAEAARVPGLSVTLNDVPLAPAAYGIESPLDPGTFRVVAQANGYESVTVDGTLGAEADRQVVEIPALEALPQAPSGVEPSAPAPLPPAEARGGIGAPVLIAGGITLALGAGTAVTGVLYLGARSDFHELNDDPEASPGEREDERSSAATLGTVSTVLGAATLVGAGATIYLLLSQPKTEQGAVSVLPAVGPRFQGVLVSGAL